jgi:hypothetical protein
MMDDETRFGHICLALDGTQIWDCTTRPVSFQPLALKLVVVTSTIDR